MLFRAGWTALLCILLRVVEDLPASEVRYLIVFDDAARFSRGSRMFEQAARRAQQVALIGISSP